MRIEITRQQAITLQALLRRRAIDDRQSHGPNVERPGALLLTPTEMELFAEYIEVKQKENAP